MELKEPKENDIMPTPYGILTPVGDLEALKKGLDYFIRNPDYLQSCKSQVLKRILDFEKVKILETYKEHIFGHEEISYKLE